MAGRGSKNHVHKYHKIDLSYNKVWACALDDCTHYMPFHMESFVPGKRSLCWACGGIFMLDHELMKLDRPICRDCAMVKSGMDELLSEV
jgi:hypothetical protein